MKRGRYVRVTAFLVPFPSPFSFSTDLETVAIFSSTLWVMEGWVRNDLCVGSRFYLIARIREGQRCLGKFESGRIQRIERQYALTHQELFQFVRVPPSRGETFGEFALVDNS
jgi:hypothetical protein